MRGDWRVGRSLLVAAAVIWSTASPSARAEAVDEARGETAVPTVHVECRFEMTISFHGFPPIDVERPETEAPSRIGYRIWTPKAEPSVAEDPSRREAALRSWSDRATPSGRPWCDWSSLE